MRVNRSLVLMKHSTIKTSDTVDYQCKVHGHRMYDYEIEITTGEQLDGSDFIIDHTIIHRVIENVIQTKMGSCERLCLTVEEDVLEALKEHGCTVQRLVFMIKPVDSNAWVKVVGEYDEHESKSLYERRDQELREMYEKELRLLPNI